MIHRFLIPLALTGMLFLLIAGCSGSSGSVNPLIPDHPEYLVAVESAGVSGSNNSGHDLLGTWMMTYDPETNKVSIDADRSLLGHFNIKTMVPPPGISINSYDPVEEILDVDVTIQNPFTLSGYDVRVIIYTDNSGHTLINEDNWTTLFDIPGGFNMNPFKAYAKTEPNRLFAGQTSHEENMLIKMPGGNFAVNFAIDASYPSNCTEPYQITDLIQEEILYDRPDSTAAVHLSVFQWDDLKTIDVTLTCPELFGADVIELDSTDNEYFFGDVVNYGSADAGEYDIIIEANAESPVSLYSLDTITVTEKEIAGWAMQFDGGDGVSGLVTDQNGNVVIGIEKNHVIQSFTKDQVENWTFDTYALSIYHDISDISYAPEFDFIYATAQTLFCGTTHYSGLDVIRVDSELTDPAEIKDMCVNTPVIPRVVTGDSYGNAVNVGHSFNLGPAMPVMWKVDNNLNTVFTKYFQQNNGSLYFNDLIFSNSDTILGAGYFTGTLVDIDPGSGTMNLTLDGTADGYISEFSSDGDFIKVRHFGGNSDPDAEVYPACITSDSAYNILILGAYSGTVDFDPAGFGYDIRTSTGIGSDLFLCRYSPTLSYDDSLGIYSTVNIYPHSFALDDSDNIYICGEFEGTVDFDPGSAIVNKDSSLGTDAFLAKYTSTYDFVWVRTWGNAQDCIGSDIAYDDVYDQVYFAGTYNGTIDFDPGESTVFEMTAPDDNTPFLMRLTPEGLW